MIVEKKFLLRKSTGDQPIAESELRDWYQKGQCKPADFVYDFGAKTWSRLGDHAALSALFAEKPAQVPERRVIYFLAPGGSPASPQGPFSTKEIQQRAQLRELCASTWVFVEGDKEWRQVRNVKILNDMLPALPADHPAPPAEAAAPAPAAVAKPEAEFSLDSPSLSLSDATDEPPAFAPPSMLDFGVVPSTPPGAPPAATPPNITNPSISIDLGMGGSNPSLKTPALDTAAPPPFSPPPTDTDEPLIEREEATLAIDVMGLDLHSESVTPPPAPPKPVKPGITAKPGIAPMPSPAAPSAVPPGAPPSAPPKQPPAGASAAPGLSIETPPGGTPKPKKPLAVGDSDFDGIVAEIPMEPIWLVKTGTSETVSGPFRFLEVVKFLEEGKLTKNDKISRQGTKSFMKIQQQYEFNVKFSVETVVENGQEKQKILIRRRHPRVPYMTGVQIVSKYGLLAGQCVNISAGGILMEVPKAEFNLGEIIEVKILPGLIAKSISCKSLIIGKIPKAPPGYALKFEDLKPDDKEAIEYYVQETLKREMSKKS